MSLPEDRKLGVVTFSVLDSEGKSCWSVTERNTGAIGNPYSRKVRLAPGSYVLSVKSTMGLSGEQRFAVKDVGTDQPIVRLTIR